MPEKPRLHLVSEDEGHRVTTLELFFDLVFVYAITQTTALMHYPTTPPATLNGSAPRSF